MSTATRGTRRRIGACGLGLMMLAMASQASSGERRSELPSAGQVDSERSECDGNVALEVRRAFGSVDQRLAAYQELKATYQTEKNALLSERTLYGFGPVVGSPDARKLAEIATGIRFVANSSRRVIERLAPFSAVDLALGSTKVGRSIYQKLQDGEKIYDAVQDPIEEFAKGIAKKSPLGKVLVGQIEIAQEIEASVEEFQAIEQSQKDWTSYVRELRSRIDRLDRGMLEAEHQIAATRLQAEKIAMSQVARFCLEQAKQLAAEGGAGSDRDLAGSPYSEGSPYAAGVLEHSSMGSAPQQRPIGAVRREFAFPSLPMAAWKSTPAPARQVAAPTPFRPPIRSPESSESGRRPVSKCHLPAGSACAVQ